MRMREQTRRSQPASFTLIELLVVIAIIAVLVSLTSAAVMRVLVHGPRVTTRTEIGQMETSMASFKTQYPGAKFIPSRIKLSPTNNYPNRATTGTDDFQSVQWLSMIFGKNINLTPSKTLVHDWSGSGSTSDFVLEGPECLVFFLGGIPTAPSESPGCLGFSTDTAFPAKAGGNRIAPFFQGFVGDRLVRSSNPKAVNFLNFLDPWRKVPYAYYSSYNNGNDYHDPAVVNDCATLSGTYGPIQPFFKGAGNSKRFINEKGCQIISAGANFQFGPGGNSWTEAAGYANSGPGVDDMSNFSKTLLGIAPN